MRMSSHGVSAADVVNRAKVSDLIRIFGFLGEEKQSGRIARAIEKRRWKSPSSTTRDLAGLIEVTSPRARPRTRSIPPPASSRRCAFSSTTSFGELAKALVCC